MRSPILFRISRYVMALLFVFSGVAKGLNPFGLSIQLGEYFSAMGLDFLAPLAGIGAVLLPAIETLIGLMLLVGLCRRLASWAVMLFMAFFTLLTLWIALYNPVTDCGCFGDLLKISNWQTFIKNIVLLPFALVLFVTRNKAMGCVARPWMWGVIVPLSLALPVYTTFTLPVIDATPFKIGVNIPQSMVTPESTAEYETIVIYKNIQDGSVKEFELSDTTWYDGSKWEYVDTRTTMQGEESSAAIKSLPMFLDGSDIAPLVLARRGTQLIVVAPLAAHLSQDKIVDRIEKLGKSVNQVVILSASPFSDLPTRAKNMAVTNSFDVLSSDYTVLRTMIQNCRGGAILLQDGVIRDKWSMNNLPLNIQ